MATVQSMYMATVVSAIKQQKICTGLNIVMALILVFSVNKPKIHEILQNNFDKPENGIEAMVHHIRKVDTMKQFIELSSAPMWT